jgi:hypothetical protein
MSTGYLPGAHQKDCPIFKKVAAKKPAWMEKAKTQDAKRKTQDAKRNT